MKPNLIPSGYAERLSDYGNSLNWKVIDRLINSQFAMFGDKEWRSFFFTIFSGTGPEVAKLVIAAATDSARKAAANQQRAEAFRSKKSA